jgi:hypothetical protein
MNRNELIAKRTMKIQRQVQSRADYCEEHGIPFYGSSECASEEAEEEWNRIYGTDDEGEDE